MEQTTCLVHTCTTLTDKRWCQEHSKPAKGPQVPCPECGRPKTQRPTACIFCSRAMRFYGTYHPKLRKCKTCGEVIQGKNRARAIYCGKKCKYADPEVRVKMGPPRNQVTKTCKGCEQEFSVPASNSSRYNYCTIECSLDHRGELVPCPRCGQMFRRSFNSTRKHCSEECRRPAFTIQCAECGQGFRILPSRIGRRKFCSKACYVRHTGETSIETRVRRILENAGFLYFQEHQIGRWAVDFVVLPNVVIEADGDYWHSLRPEVDARKNAELEALGYRVVRYTETQINSDSFEKQLITSIS